MCNFKSGLIAKYENGMFLHWDFQEDSHSELMRSLVEKKGQPLEVCPIEVTCGEITIDLEKEAVQPWMKKYVKENKKEIRDIEVQTLEWMKTHELKELHLSYTKGFVIPKGIKIRNIYAFGAKGLVFEGPVVADYLNIGNTENVIIPKGSKIETIHAYGAENLVFEGPIVVDFLDVSNTENVIIPKGSKMRIIRASGSKNLVIEDGCEIGEIIQ